MSIDSVESTTASRLIMRLLACFLALSLTACDDDSAPTPSSIIILPTADQFMRDAFIADQGPPPPEPDVQPPAECDPQPEVCNNRDDDCDSFIDEAVTCSPGLECSEGVCRELSGAAEPCDEDADCLDGYCNADLPGGFCQVECALDDDCGLAICTELGPRNLCLQPCGPDGDCRPGWRCLPEIAACVPSCENFGCGYGRICADSGLCEWPIVSISLGTVFILPAKATGHPWDGFGGRVSQELIDGAVSAAFGQGIISSLLGYFGRGAIAALAKPDPYGIAGLSLPSGWSEGELSEIRDTFTPAWQLRWDGVRLDDSDVRLFIALTDADVNNDDVIDTVEISTAELREALYHGEMLGIRTVDQGAGQIVAVSVSVRLLE